MSKKTKILFYGDSPYIYSGFAQVLRNIILEVYKTKRYDIKVFAIHQPVYFDEFGRVPNQYNNWKNKKDIYPYDIDILPKEIEVISANWFTKEDEKIGFQLTLQGQHKLIQFLALHDIDILFILNDPYVFEHTHKDLIALKEAGKKFITIFYFPVDAEYVDKKWYEIASKFDLPVTYTKWGIELAKKKYPEIVSEKKLDYIYHGTNIKEF